MQKKELKGAIMEPVPAEVKEAVEHYLSLLTPENRSIMLARLVIAVAMQEDGQTI